MVRSGAASRLGDILHQHHEAAADGVPVVALLDQAADVPRQVFGEQLFCYGLSARSGDDVGEVVEQIATGHQRVFQPVHHTK
jgi:hypothetical protein